MKLLPPFDLGVLGEGGFNGEIAGDAEDFGDVPTVTDERSLSLSIEMARTRRLGTLVMASSSSLEMLAAFARALRLFLLLTVIAASFSLSSLASSGYGLTCEEGAGVGRKERLPRNERVASFTELLDDVAGISLLVGVSKLSVAIFRFFAGLDFSSILTKASGLCGLEDKAGLKLSLVCFFLLDFRVAIFVDEASERRSHEHGRSGK